MDSFNALGRLAGKSDRNRNLLIIVSIGKKYIHSVETADAHHKQYSKTPAKKTSPLGVVRRNTFI
jgi:hypothetical protein